MSHHGSNASDVTQVGALLHGQGTVAFGDAGCWGMHKRQEALGQEWQVAMQLGKRRQIALTRV